MAHELEIVNGEAAMAYVGQTPWHGLGKKVPADLSPEQMLKAANLDWAVEKRDVYYKDTNGNMKIAPNKKSIVRASDDKFFSITSDAWNPVQNIDAFRFFDDFVKSGNMEMHTAGSLRDGKIVWAMAQIKESFEIFGGDRVDGYLLFSNPHEFGRSIDIRFTPIRVVCNNTLTFSLDQASKSSVTLTHRSKFNPEEIKATLGIAKDLLGSYKQAAKFLGSKKFTKESINEYFNRVFPSMSYDDKKKEEIEKGLYAKEPVSRQAKEAKEVMHTQPGAEFGQGTWWQAFNTVTYLTDHKLGRSKDARLTSAWYGQNQKRKQHALQLATEYAEVA